MDWQRCVICQKRTSEPLKCPLRAHVGAADITEPYKTFLANVEGFRKLDKLPVTLAFTDETTVQDFVANKAQWHASCHKKFSKYRLDRLQNLQKDMEEAGPSSETGPRKKRLKESTPFPNICIFCSKDTGLLHEVCTFNLDTNIRTMAEDLQDTSVQARISNSDLMALEGKYHLPCLTDFRNRHRSLMRQRRRSESVQAEDGTLKARAFIELTTYIESSIQEGNFIFEFAYLRQLYTTRLLDLGVQQESVNKDVFKGMILEYFPKAQEQRQGKKKVLVFEQGMQDLLKQALTCNYEEDASTLAKAAKTVRRDICNRDSFSFDASFPSKCQADSVPTSLKILVSMLLNGTDIRKQDPSESQACLTISQLILFNCKRKTKPTSSSDKSRHSQQNEPPLPLYLGMKAHTQTRSKSLIAMLYEVGLSVSYFRILQIENQLASAVCNRTQEEGVVCPTQLRHGLFTVGALDNLDYNPSSTSAEGSFHGTGISLFQSPTKANPGQIRTPITLSTEQADKHFSLPDSFATVPAVALKESTVEVPKHAAVEKQTPAVDKSAAKQPELMWLAQATELLGKQELQPGDSITWSAFHASSKDSGEKTEAALSQLLPMFYEKAATAAMMKHGMDVIRQSTQFLNPNQIPVMAVDAPLFALAKYIQWKWPQTHGEDKLVVMFGGLHAEMAWWNSLGDYLQGSGWTSALVQAGIATSGKAESLLRCSHLTRTRLAHQISALCLAKLQKEAFSSTSGDHSDEDMEVWKKQMISKSPTFQYWNTILSLELLGLVFVRSHREADFGLYVESLKEMAPWFFALNHQNYARWIPVHIHDMENLPAAVQEEFCDLKHWVISKTPKRFSAMPIDQAHEQNNSQVKGSGGAVGLTENPLAFRRWMLSGPEQARLLREFEEGITGESAQDQSHHEEGLASQKCFQKQTNALVDTIQCMGNPFMESGSELLVLDSHDVMPETVVQTVRTIEAVGKEQYIAYTSSVLEQCTKSIHEPIKKNTLPLFKCPAAKQKQPTKTAELKDDVSLFSRLFVVAQKREADLDNFFRHENHPYPPSISDRGKLRAGTKSDLLPCLLKCQQELSESTEYPDITQIAEFDFENTGDVDVLDVPSDVLEGLASTPEPEGTAAPKTSESDPPSCFDVAALDGTAVLHFLSPRECVTFNDYASKVFKPYLLQQLGSTKRLDIIWDSYIEKSLKESTREKRGQGSRRKVEGKTKIPNWQEFLRDPTNKKELFDLLSDFIAKTAFPSDKVVVVTHGKKTIMRGTDKAMPDCHQEEADTRIVFHLLDAIRQGAVTCTVRTVDTDVIAILIGKFHSLQVTCPDLTVWAAFGTGKNFRHINIGAIAASLQEDKAKALPAFHSFSGCDTVSAFFGIGKQKAWLAWKCFPDVTQVFKLMMEKPFKHFSEDSDEFRVLERFTILLYDKTSSLQSINECRKVLFCKKDKPTERIPPTQGALFQHAKRAAFQAGVWATCDESQENLPSPEGWGWTSSPAEKTWQPYWTSSDIASKACKELVRCGCKTSKGCSTNRCACKKALWPCTALCKCSCDK